MPAWEKIRHVSELTRAYEGFALSGLRARHPGASERELRLRLAAMLLGDDVVLQLFGFDASDA